MSNEDFVTGEPTAVDSLYELLGALEGQAAAYGWAAAHPSVTAKLEQSEVWAQALRDLLEVPEEEDLSHCPHYLGEGICQSGCWEEPRCFTDEPSEGWPLMRAVDPTIAVLSAVLPREQARDLAMRLWRAKLLRQKMPAPKE